MWRCVPIIAPIRRLRQEDHKLEASLDYIVRSCPSPKQANKKNL
jgi:hypothetical protein